MSKRKYITFRILITIILATLAGITGSEGGWWWGLLLIVAAISILLFIRYLFIRYLSPKKLKEAMTDERTKRIQEKAAAMAIRIFFPAVMVIGASLVVLSYKAGFDFSQVGITLIYTVFALALLVITLRFHYDREF